MKSTFNYIIIISVFLLSNAFASPWATPLCSQEIAPVAPKIDDQCQPANNFPPIGKWVLTAGGTKYYPKEQVANWLGQLDKNGHHIIEPINIIIRVNANNLKTAKLKTLLVLGLAGFIRHIGHSDGYEAFIDGKKIPQWNSAHATDDINLGTFSDKFYIYQNDHLRLFGPYNDGGSNYILTGSCSEEGPNYAKPSHAYVSFAHCLSAIQNGLNKYINSMPIQTIDKIFNHSPPTTSTIVMNNSISVKQATKPGFSGTTGDYQGTALLLDIY